MRHTKKLGLNLPEDDDLFGVEHQNENMEKLDEKMPRAANNLVTTEEGYYLDARQGESLVRKIEDLKKSVGDGKSTVASAITDKGVSTAADASFNTMATNIKTIQTGPKTKYESKEICFCGSYPELFCDDGKCLIHDNGQCVLQGTTISYAQLEWTLKAYNQSSTNGSHIFGDTSGRIQILGQGGIQVYRSSNIDCSNLDKIIVSFDTYASNENTSRHLKGWVGLADPSSVPNTTNDGNNNIIMPKSYEITKGYSFEHFFVIFDVSNINEKKCLQISLVNIGQLNIESITRIPK